MSHTVSTDRVFEDKEIGIFFEKRDASNKLLGKVTPEEIGFEKEMTMTIYIEKAIQSEDVLESTVSVFSQELVISVKARFKYVYLTKTNSGIVHQKDFASGCASAVNINSEGEDSPIEIKYGRAKKLPNDSFLSKSVPIFKIQNGVYERRLSID